MPILEQEASCHPADLLDAEQEPLGLPSLQDDRRWWAVYTKARQEKAVARHLVERDVPFYLPLIPKDNVIRNRRVRSHIPLFTGYVFLFGSEDERVTTLATNRISRIFSVADQRQLWIDLANVALLIKNDAPLAIERRIITGDLVRVKTGLLKGLEGVVIKRHSKCRLLVAVRYLQQGVSVEIDDCALETI
ncbi:MAG: antitermination protein NusG [Planctomycetes bacterium]|nr:antitermination protein NusG [Planctomycetota bacterium]